MSDIANTGRRGRTLVWLGIAAAVVAIAVFRARVTTVLYLGLFLSAFVCGTRRTERREKDDVAVTGTRSSSERASAARRQLWSSPAPAAYC